MDSSGLLYVANGKSQKVTVYSSDVFGNQKPIRTIAGPKTRLDNPWGIAVDASGNVYVSNHPANLQGPGTITVFAATAEGNAKPIRTIEGSKTGLYGST
ncbi:MAG TPA: hypothetical protein VGF18_01245, partial [Candidatus Tumulicola sp.]